ncbi:MAG: response regulator transcription factor [Burkholderiaceae bacterium]|jgi:DNA-binding NarL/FixJ family response regulator|nr:response regulator transcription factor [Burkholderiaceae bacterium]
MTNIDSTRFFVIDDHPLMREALVMMLRRLKAGAQIVELSHIGALREAVERHGTPALICLDLKLPDAVGTSGVLEVHARYPDVPLAVVSASPAEDFETACLDAGADVFISKSSPASDILAALRSLLAADGEPDFEDTTGTGGGQGIKMSKRQKQLIIMLDQGLSNRDIASQLDISEHTVKVHLWRLFRRLGVNSRTQALHFARENGLLG